MAQHETYNFLDPKYMEHDFRMPPETCIFKAVYTYGANIPFESVDVDMTTDNIVTNIDLIDYHGTIQIGTNFFKLTNQ